MTYRKKLIEVALPLDAINDASSKEKSIRQGHPSTLHLWWSRKPLATSRAVLFASLIDDPSEHPEEFPTERAQKSERERLFKLIEQLVLWENSNNEDLLAEIRTEILKSTKGNLPCVLDPFAGGGSIPLEAQRLGLEVNARDLNPVAVLINKALIEIPPKFVGLPPVNPDVKETLVEGIWHGVKGLASDIRYYGKWMRDEAEHYVGHLYPKVTLPIEYGGGEATVIAWLWVRTVTCPNPACGAQMPLASKWWLSKKEQSVWVDPVINHDTKNISFKVVMGKPDADLSKNISKGSCCVDNQGKKTKATFECVFCNVGIAKGDYIDSEANKGQIGVMPMAIVASTKKGRIYLPADEGQIKNIQDCTFQYLSQSSIKAKIPMEPARGTFASNAQGRIYGFKTFANYFTSRQLVMLINFCELIQKVKEKIISDAHSALSFSSKLSTHNKDINIQDYAYAVVTYLGLGLSKVVDYNCTAVTWSQNRDQATHAFTKQGFSMVWDYAEVNPFAGAAGDLTVSLGGIADVLENMFIASSSGFSNQMDAQSINDNESSALISTDPPYYDNISYADLADFFYIWLRRALNDIYPDLFGTMLLPKSQELIATPYRFNGNKDEARQFFETGLGKAFASMRLIQHKDFPLTIYYAFKQSESDADEKGGNGYITTASTGWETMLEGLIRAGFTITGTWPIRTERLSRSVGQGTNALASSIVLVCRPRPVDAEIASRRQFLNALRAELAIALKQMQQGTIAPVDLAQASIGPGMAIYSRYSKVVEADGSPLAVRAALQLINQELDVVLAEQEGEYDVETRWAVAWFEEYAMDEGAYGRAETLSKAKNASIQTLVDAGVLEAKAGKVRLLKRTEFSTDWKPNPNLRLTAWEVMQRTIHGLDKGSESGAGKILALVPEMSEVVRDLAYRLYVICERKGWSQEAQYYNMLVTSWSGIGEQARTIATAPEQSTFAF